MFTFGIVVLACGLTSLQHVPTAATVAEVLTAVSEALEANSIMPLPSLDWVTSNNINGRVFQTLTSDDLIEMGVSLLGICWLVLSLQARLANTTISGRAMHEVLMVCTWYHPTTTHHWMSSHSLFYVATFRMVGQMPASVPPSAMVNLLLFRV